MVVVVMEFLGNLFCLLMDKIGCKVMYLFLMFLIGVVCFFFVIFVLFGNECKNCILFLCYYVLSLFLWSGIYLVLYFFFNSILIKKIKIKMCVNIMLYIIFLCEFNEMSIKLIKLMIYFLCWGVIIFFNINNLLIIIYVLILSFYLFYFFICIIFFWYFLNLFIFLF